MTDEEPKCEDCGNPMSQHSREVIHNYISFPGKCYDGCCYECDDYNGPKREQFVKTEYEKAKLRGYEHSSALKHGYNFIDILEGEIPDEICKAAYIQYDY